MKNGEFGILVATRMVLWNAVRNHLSDQELEMLIDMYTGTASDLRRLEHNELAPTVADELENIVKQLEYVKATREGRTDVPDPSLEGIDEFVRATKGIAD